MKRNNFCVGDKVKVNKKVTLRDIEENRFEGCQIGTMDFLKKASLSHFNNVYEVEEVSYFGNPMIDGWYINGKVLNIVNGPILDDKEKEYLKAVINPFRKKVEYIEKNVFSIDKEYIEIALESESIVLPNFKKGTMYKKMKSDKKYTLKELEL